jgi:cytochrome oxidase assembly protein ShyY1
VLIPLPELSEGPHLAYAVQWFLFAVMALGYFGLLARREAHDRRAVAEGRAPVVAVRVSG